MVALAMVIGGTVGRWVKLQVPGLHPRPTEAVVLKIVPNEPAFRMFPEEKSYSLLLMWEGPWARAGVTNRVGSMFKKCLVDGSLFRGVPEFALTCLPCTAFNPGCSCLIDTNLLCDTIMMRLHLRRM